MSNPKAISIDTTEVEKFSRIADEWWDLNGKFKPLHKLNPVRIEYIKQVLGSRGWVMGASPELTLLDIGCGGGLLAEPMAKLGAKVTGIDASEKNIKVASLHAEKSGLDINYIATSAEELAESGKQFDVVLNMEVIEHVANVVSFMEASCKLVKPGGIIIIATLNRTLKSFAFAIVGAEYVLRWLPRGTHNWDKFLKPSEINTYFEENALRLEDITGVTLNPIKNEWHTSNDIDVNYMMLATRPASAA